MFRANSFLLSLCSPVLHKMLCGEFSESNEKKLKFQEVKKTTFCKALDLWYGKDNNSEMGLCEVKELANIADRFQMTEIVSALDQTVKKNLNISVCGDVLSWCGGFGLRQSEEAARKLATEHFEEVAKTDGFMHLSEEELGLLIDDNDLVTRKEEVVWEAVARWKTAPEGQSRGRGLPGLVGKIRFPLMEEGYLRSRMVGLAPAEDAEWMVSVVAEALRAKAARQDRVGFEFQLLGPKALDWRVWRSPGTNWPRYMNGGEQRRNDHAEDVLAVAECKERMCSGSEDGSIVVWHIKGAMDWAQRLAPRGKKDPVWSLSVWEGVLISGHQSGMLKVWNVASCELWQVLQGHTNLIATLSVCEQHLVSGSADGSVKVWARGLKACERVLLGHTDWVRSLAGWQGKVISASDDHSIRVWDIGTGTHDATLTGHTDGVGALAVHGDRLFSASRDGTIREWALGASLAWAALRTVEAYSLSARLRLGCLVVSGTQLVSGAYASGVDGGSQGEVRVWGLEALDLQHTLPQPSSVWTLLAVKGGVWAGVGRSVTMWGGGS
jgi:hypothetical protein